MGGRRALNFRGSVGKLVRCDLLWPLGREFAVVRKSAFIGMVCQRLLFLTAVQAIGCGSNSASSMSTAGPANAGTGGQSFSVGTAESITFSPADTVLLKLGETAFATVVVQPDSTYDVSLALLDGSNDAALSATVVTTSSTGRAQFSITASSVAASFGVRASVGSKTAILPVSVSDSGYATLDVTGNYSGVRKVSTWVATLKDSETCSAFGSSLPNDGVIGAQNPASPPNLTITNVPVGPVQSVILRGDHSVWGCKDLPALTSGQILDAPIQLFDIPAVYTSDPVPADFTVSTNVDLWTTNLAATKNALVGGFEQSWTSDVEHLLDGMQSAILDSQTQTEFAQRRTGGNWHSVVANQWSSLDGSGDQCLATALDRWLSAGIAQLASGVEINTRLKLISPSASLGQEQLTLASMAGFPPNDYAPTTDFPLSTTFGANDGMAASATVSFNEAHLLRLLAASAAERENTAATDLPSALTSVAGCDVLGANLNAAASSSSLCDASCLAELCTQALAQMWNATASTADQRGTTKLTLSCSGTLQLDANAVVRGYSGTWVGMMTSPSGNVSTGGPIG